MTGPTHFLTTPRYASGSCRTNTSPLWQTDPTILVEPLALLDVTLLLKRPLSVDPLLLSFLALCLVHQPVGLSVPRQTATGAFLCARPDAATSRNPRAPSAPACQIHSHNSPGAATNVNLRKGESVQSLSTAILTRMLWTCSVEINRRVFEKEYRQDGA